MAASMFQLDNFILGMHTKPALVRGGSRYARDIKNLRIDSDGFLRLRSQVSGVGPDGADIEGVAASATHLFVLREGGELTIRSEDDLETEIPVTVEGTVHMQGRISIVSEFRDYVVITSEGPDQGFWIDMRDGQERIARRLGLDKPAANSFSLSSNIPDDVDPTALVVYTVTYTREFQSGIGKVAVDDLFNGMESEPADTQYFFTAELSDDDFEGFGDNYLASEDAVWRYEPVIGNLTDGEVNLQTTTLAVRFEDLNGVDWGDEIRATLADSVGKQLRIVNQTREGHFIRGVMESVRYSAVSASIQLSDISGNMSSGSSSNGDSVKITVVDSEAGEDITPGDYYSAILSDFVFPDDDQITGINIYRSAFYRDNADIIEGEEENEEDDYDRLKMLVDEDDEDRDFSTLQFRKVHYLRREEVDTLVDGVYIEVEEEDGVDVTFRRPYIQLPDGDRMRYVWTDQVELDYNTNNRLPSESKQIHFYLDRVYAAVGDRLIYSDIRNGVPYVWAFPEINEVRTDKRCDFCAEHREVLLFGAKDGLFRLTGTDRYDHQVDEISPVGPVDSFAWGKLKDYFGYITENGLYLSDNTTVEFVSDEVLDRFFENHSARTGAVVFFADDTILFSVGLLEVGFTNLEDFMFLYNDKHWVRWEGLKVEQLASLVTNDTDYFVADGSGILKHIDWHNTNNSDSELEWFWESNLITGLRDGDANFMKRFQEIRIAGVEKPMTLTYWLDEGGANFVDFRTRDSVFEKVIPLNRWARRFRFRISGTGPVTLRGLRLEGERK